MFFVTVESSRKRCVNVIFMQFHVRDCVSTVKSCGFKPVPGDRFCLVFRLHDPLDYLLSTLLMIDSPLGSVVLCHSKEII